MILQHKYDLFQSENIPVMCRFQYGVYIRNKGFRGCKQHTSFPSVICVRN